MAGKALDEITLRDLIEAYKRVFPGWIFIDPADPHSADKAKGMVPLPPPKPEKKRPVFEVPLQALKTVPKDPHLG